MKRERFSISRILSVFAVVAALMALPSVGYTMSYNQGFVDGESQQVSELQTQISTLSTRMGEMEADLYRVNDAIITGTGGQGTSEKLSMADPENNGIECHTSIDDKCHVNPEVGWRGIF